jgi:phosphoadenosine phosphosulfate reductase
MLLTEDALRRAEERLSALDPVAILRLVHATFGHRAAILSSMQRAGTTLCHMADRAGLDLDVAFVDTGVLHPETIATRDELARTHPRLRVVTLAPELTLAEQTRRRGVLYLTKEGQEECCELRKSAPLRAQRGRWDALVGALMREEGGRRARVPFVAVDAELGAVRIHPFAASTRDDLDRYAAAHPDLVVNPLHAMGFPTIGCYPCTTPVRPDEPERAGRWRHLADVTYCGINPTDRGEGARPPIALDDRYAPLFA